MDQNATDPPAAEAKAAAERPRRPRPKKRKRLFLKQPAMQRVCYALVPVLLAGIYFFGWRVVALLAACTAGGLAAEGVMTRRRGKPISQACFVTCMLYALSLPPTMPLWMALVGIVAGILFGKEVFGGFGRNFANPAIVGRAFVYVAFPTQMTRSFVPVFRGLAGGFAHWSFASLATVPAGLPDTLKSGVDALTAATPMWAARTEGFQTSLSELFFGDVGGRFGGGKVLAAGSIGEVSALLILVAGVYLAATKTANWRLMLGPLLGAALACLVFRELGGAKGIPPLPFTLLSGGLLYGAVYMVTEPVSAPKKTPAIWAYGVVIGVLIVVLRWRSQFSGAVAFSILMGNILAPSLDLAVGAWQKRRKSAQGSS